MPNINLTWTPGVGVTQQILSARVKGTTTWMESGFDVNPVGGGVSTAIFQNAAINTIYEFKVETICGDVRSEASNTHEGIVLDCGNWSTNTLTDTSVKALIPSSMLSASISQVDVQLFDNTQTLIDTKSIQYTGGNVEFTFALLAGQSYTLKLRLFATVNGISVVLASGKTGCSLAVTATGGVVTGPAGVSHTSAVTQAGDSIEYYFRRIQETGPTLAQQICITYDIFNSFTNSIVASQSREILPNEVNECGYITGAYCNEFGSGGGISGSNYTIINVVGTYC